MSCRVSRLKFSYPGGDDTRTTTGRREYGHCSPAGQRAGAQNGKPVKTDGEKWGEKKKRWPRFELLNTRRRRARKRSEIQCTAYANGGGTWVRVRREAIDCSGDYEYERARSRKIRSISCAQAATVVVVVVVAVVSTCPSPCGGDRTRVAVRAPRSIRKYRARIVSVPHPSPRSSPYIAVPPWPSPMRSSSSRTPVCLSILRVRPSLGSSAISAKLFGLSSP